MWVTGEPLVYTNWFPGEPNNAGGVEDYIHIGAAGQWNDLPNQVVRAYMVEFDTPISTPLPAGLPLLGTGLAALFWRAQRVRRSTAAWRSDEHPL